MLEMKSLCGSEVGENAESCYAELLSLKFFRRAIKNYTSKKIDDNRIAALEAELSSKTGMTRQIGFSE